MITLNDILASLPLLRNISEKERLEYSKEIGLLVKKKSDLLALEAEYSKILELSKTLSQDVEILTNPLLEYTEPLFRKFLNPTLNVPTLLHIPAQSASLEGLDPPV